VHQQARDWYERQTFDAADWTSAQLLAVKGAQRISVVIPARNEESSVGSVVTTIRAELVEATALVDELIVIDSLSTDATADQARAHGAVVHSVADIRADLGVRAGKGEALWKSQFVATGDLLVFIDADLTEWGPHFVTGLLGPMLTDPATLLVKGFYDRLFESDNEVPSSEGGRVTELVARPLLAARWPELAALVQPLAGEWAIRRSLFERLPVPVGYGVEFATLVDTWAQHGLDALAQVDLGRRGHRHQSVHDLSVMALEILRVADVRSGLADASHDPVELAQFDRTAPDRWRTRSVPTLERPPAVEVLT
jgi:glucosyl-3-phosphoglycerate synthase